MKYHSRKSLKDLPLLLQILEWRILRLAHRDPDSLPRLSDTPSAQRAPTTSPKTTSSWSAGISEFSLHFLPATFAITRGDMFGPPPLFSSLLPPSLPPTRRRTTHSSKQHVRVVRWPNACVMLHAVVRGSHVDGQVEDGFVDDENIWLYHRFGCHQVLKSCRNGTTTKATLSFFLS